MKTTTLCQLMAVGSFSLVGLSSPLMADGPADLEALAEKARQAAEESVPPLKKAPEAPSSKEKKKAKPAPKKKAEAPKTKPKSAPKSAPKAAPKPEVKPAPKPAAKEVPKKKKQAKPKKAAVDLAKRADKVGLAANLSKDVSMLMTFGNGERLWNEVVESEMGDILIETLADNEVDLRDPDSPGAQFAALFKEEFLLALGKETPRQLENLTALNNLNEKYETARMVRLWMMGLNGEGAFMDPNPFGSLAEALSENPDFLVNLVAATKMPPMLMAARISDEEQLDEFATLLEMGEAMALEMAAGEMPFVAGAEAEVGGISFSGISVDGEGLLEALQEAMDLQAVLEGFMDPASSKDMMDSLGEKDLVMLGGVSEDAIYLYLGNDADGIPLVDDFKKGIAATSEFAFVDPYLNKPLVNLFWMEDSLVKLGATGQPIFKNYIDGIRMALKDSEPENSTRRFQRMLGKVERLEKAYFASGQYQNAASLSFIGADGLYTEGFGGIVDNDYDWATPHQLGTVQDDVFLTVQGVVNPEGSKLAEDYMEAAVAAAYEGVTLLNGLDEVPLMLEEFSEGFSLFDQKMKKDALALWSGLSSAGAGLGLESIMEIDLAGSWPTVPGVPDAVIENGLAPRVSYVAPVTDRKKLAASWKETEGAVTKILKTVSEMAGEKIPMQKPMSSQNDGLKTWFFPIPMQTDDFVLSITLDDEVMVMGTSKERAVVLAAAAKKKGPGETGVVMEMKFAPLQSFLSNWLALVEENPKELLTDEDLLDFYLENQEKLEAAVAAMGEFDSWRTHTRMEDGQLRTSSHFKTK